MWQNSYVSLCDKGTARKTLAYMLKLVCNRHKLQTHTVLVSQLFVCSASALGGVLKHKCVILPPRKLSPWKFYFSWQAERRKTSMCRNRQMCGEEFWVGVRECLRLMINLQWTPATTQSENGGAAPNSSRLLICNDTGFHCGFLLSVV